MPSCHDLFSDEEKVLIRREHIISKVFVMNGHIINFLPCFYKLKNLPLIHIKHIFQVVLGSDPSQRKGTKGLKYKVKL